MTPSGLMIIGYPALMLILLGSSMLLALVSAFLVRTIPSRASRILIILLVFSATLLGLTILFYLRFHFWPIHIELIRGLDV